MPTSRPSASPEPCTGGAEPPGPRHRRTSTREQHAPSRSRLPARPLPLPLPFKLPCRGARFRPERPRGQSTRRDCRNGRGRAVHDGREGGRSGTAMMGGSSLLSVCWRGRRRPRPVLAEAGSSARSQWGARRLLKPAPETRAATGRLPRLPPWVDYGSQLGPRGGAALPSALPTAPGPRAGGDAERERSTWRRQRPGLTGMLWLRPFPCQAFTFLRTGGISLKPQAKKRKKRLGGTWYFCKLPLLWSPP